MEKIQRQSRAGSFRVSGEPVRLNKFQIIIDYRGLTFGKSTGHPAPPQMRPR
jgi:hypothetical protein